MYIDLSGVWQLSLTGDNGVQEGEIILPGSLQAAGFGNPITRDTPWISGLHDDLWYEQEVFQKGDGAECLVPFLCQPQRHFIGEAVYRREFMVREEAGEWFLRIELTRWRTRVWIDGGFRGEDCSLCTAHEISCGRLSKGVHTLQVSVDNSMQYPYRPDGHGVSDALGATWNGMVGEIALITKDELEERAEERAAYAEAHPRRMEFREGNFFADGKPLYFRATHFGGEYPMTGYPETDSDWWRKRMRIVRDWGLNAVRCHSYCPPEAAFQAADEEGIFLLVECGMWNVFREGIHMLEVLREETERILRQFGHHPSFAFFSPSNEPGGSWYQPLREWVTETREYDRRLGYEGRRLYTAQSGWFYDVPPAQITGTDFIYFHRSGYGPFTGGTIRNSQGWKGGDYSPSVEGSVLPVVCHELGQWCAYPDFRIIQKLTGHLQPGNFRIFQEIARENGVLPLAEKFLWCSGRNQLRLYKEELEANFRTPQLKGFELLDLHDYAGQGTALVGLLDILWEEKGYAEPEEFRCFCGDTVLLARLESYVWKNTDRVEVPVEISHFGQEELRNVSVEWRLTGEGEIYRSGRLATVSVPCGSCRSVGSITLDFAGIIRSRELILELSLERRKDNPGESREDSSENGRTEEWQCRNSWRLTVFAVQEEEKRSDKERSDKERPDKVLYTRNWQEAKEALAGGGAVAYAPYLSELSYDCPALSMKNVFWNGQMGPSWIRSLGLVVNTEHPVFQYFPSAEDGGWQWEDILENARGFWLKGMENINPIVCPIDDWNRSLSLALMFEAAVGKGRLLMITADLAGSFEERPAAYCLKQAVLRYAASEEFRPRQQISPQTIEEKLFPVLRMETLTKEYLYSEGAGVTGDVSLSANPNTSVRIEKEEFPVEITLVLRRELKIQGLVYLPEQKDRKRTGLIRDYRLEYLDSKNGDWVLIQQGTFPNTTLSRRVEFDSSVKTERIRLTVLSAYGCRLKKAGSRNGGKRELWYRQQAFISSAGSRVSPPMNCSGRRCGNPPPGRLTISIGKLNRKNMYKIMKFVLTETGNLFIVSLVA